MINILVAASNRMPMFWAFEPSWKITSFSWWRSSKRHYSRSDLILFIFFQSKQFTYLTINQNSNSIIMQKNGKFAHLSTIESITSSITGLGKLIFSIFRRFTYITRIMIVICTFWLLYRWHLFVSQSIYHSIKFSRKQNIDNVLHWIQHDDVKPNRPDIVSCHLSTLLNKLALQLWIEQRHFVHKFVFFSSVLLNVQSSIINELRILVNVKISIEIESKRTEKKESDSTNLYFQCQQRPDKLEDSTRACCLRCNFQYSKRDSYIHHGHDCM